jgi:hypothetical protein
MNNPGKRTVSERPAITIPELASLGDGQVAYIKIVKPPEAERLYPQAEGLEKLPKGMNLFALNAADGTPLALTDSLSAAIGHAIEDELDVASVH